MTYKVKYKTFNQWFWRTVKNVSGDAVDNQMQMRILILNDESRVEVPFAGTTFKFSKERFIVIKKNMEKDAGQVMPISKGNS